MLSQELNEKLTRVGPGTPMGELMRRYWHPVATCHDLALNPVRSVRILGESLTLFRDRQNRLGLIGSHCHHRLVNLVRGIPEENGLRCPYHGWMYDRTGQCIDQPCEAEEDKFADNVKLPSYPVEELGGLIWAYLGPKPAPLLPRWDLLVVDNAFRQIGTTVLPCNWLQCQENSVDTVHVEWAHGRVGKYALERQGNTDPKQIERYNRIGKKHVKIDFKITEIGIQKLRLREGEDEKTSEGWITGHPLIFPNYVRIGQLGYSEFQIRVPMDDTHTWHLGYQVYMPGKHVTVPKQDPVPAYDVPVVDLPDFVLGQDLMCWVAQGPLLDRSRERLGRSDRGLALFRELLLDQIRVVEEGGDPMNTFRDPAKNKYIDLSLEDYGDLSTYRKGAVYYYNTGACSPYLDELDALMLAGAKAASAGRPQTSAKP